MKRGISAFLTLLFLFGCSTMISEQAAQEEAEGLLALVEQGEVQEALGLSSRPFLFEGEILISEGLVSQLWTGLSGVPFHSLEFQKIAMVDQDSYKLFRDSWEVQTWFQNYTNDETALLFYNGMDKELIVVIDRNKKSEAPILGFGEAAQ